MARVHQEDFCQALGIHPQRKCQNHGGPSPKEMANLIQTHSTRPRADIETLFRALALSWMLAGTDAHAKNYSLLLGRRGEVRLAPLYDLLSALPYPRLDTHRLKLAMKVGSHYRCRDISARDWVTLARELAMEPEKAFLILHDMLAVLPGLALDCAQSMETDGLTHPIIATLVDAIAQSAAQCSRRLATIA